MNILTHFQCRKVSIIKIINRFDVDFYLLTFSLFQWSFRRKMEMDKNNPGTPEHVNFFKLFLENAKYHEHVEIALL